jgi:hypothetical protein
MTMMMVTAMTMMIMIIITIIIQAVCYCTLPELSDQLLQLKQGEWFMCGRQRKAYTAFLKEKWKVLEVDMVVKKMTLPESMKLEHNTTDVHQRQTND